MIPPGPAPDPGCPLPLTVNSEPALLLGHGVHQELLHGGGQEAESAVKRVHVASRRVRVHGSGGPGGVEVTSLGCVRVRVRGNVPVTDAVKVLF